MFQDIKQSVDVGIFGHFGLLLPKIWQNFIQFAGHTVYDRNNVYSTGPNVIKLLTSVIYECSY
jgi:hypothetical protein